MIADLVLVGVFAFVAPVVLAPISRNRPAMLMAVTAFLLAVGFLLDGLRTLQRFRKLRTS
jgi:hypothetical protein